MASHFDYYRSTLAANRLARCYELAPPRVRQYLEAEINHVLSEITDAATVLELGCGYGRVLKPIAPHVALAVGIDNSFDSLLLAQAYLADSANTRLLCMNAASTGFADCSFDGVLCIQNGISAFHVDRHELIKESLRICRPGGTVLLSSYSGKFWDHRLEWFQIQSDHGLLGPIDRERTGNGVIVCTDGFTAHTCTPAEFTLLAAEFGLTAQLTEVDDSSVFCKLTRT